MIDLKGKIALVTGASRGIGRAIAIELARWGVDVAINFKAHEQEAKATLNEVTSLRRRGVVVQADVSCPNEVKRMVATTEKELGQIDILVNNAGISRFQSHRRNHRSRLG